jgi:catechol 2,3-dioxygenase
MAPSDAPFTVAPPGHRLHPAAALGAVRLQVADLARSVAWYEQVIGLRALDKDAAHALLGVPDSTVPLVELRHRAGAAPVPKRGRLGLYHFAILLPDRAALGRFISHLAELGAQAGMADHLVSESVYLTDPDGLGIEVYADRPRSAWKVANGTLAMAVDPLDAPGLVRASGGARWTGAPAGTRIGHVHLSVADLDAAARFYHHGLGLDRVVLAFPGALFMSAGGYHHHLGTNSWSATAPRPQESDARLLEWTMVLPHADDVEAAARSLEAVGAPVTRDGGSALAADPWGTRLRLTHDGAQDQRL